MPTHILDMTFFKKMSKIGGIPLDHREFFGIIVAVYLFEVEFLDYYGSP